MLRDDPKAIAEYKACHRSTWPEVIAELHSVGVEGMKIFLHGRQMFMYLEAIDAFEPHRDFPRLNDNPRYAEWDILMRTMQEQVEDAKPEEWWSPMDEVFNLNWPQFQLVETT
jgi:L-rhamnose mutarotase